MEDEEIVKNKPVKNDDKKVKTKNLLLNLFICITALALIVTIVNTVFKVGNPTSDTFLGFKPMIITSQSMEPEIMTNALVIARQVDFDAVEVGDTITFEMEMGTLNTHKVIKKSGDSLITKGVNNETADIEPVTRTNFRYKVVSVQNWVADVQNFDFMNEIKTFKGVVQYIVLPLLAVIFIVLVIVAILSYKKSSKKKISLKESSMNIDDISNKNRETKKPFNNEEDESKKQNNNKTNDDVIKPIDEKTSIINKEEFVLDNESIDALLSEFSDFIDVDDKLVDSVMNDTDKLDELLGNIDTDANNIKDEDVLYFLNNIDDLTI